MKNKRYKVELESEYKGYKYVVTFGMYGFRCGYAGVGRSSPLYGSDYTSAEEFFQVHGGLTYAKGNSEYPIKSDLWWFGFDCGHAEDGIDVDKILEYGLMSEAECRNSIKSYEGWEVRSVEYVEQECKNMIDQIINIVTQP
jgi:hypothetical protein